MPAEISNRSTAQCQGTRGQYLDDLGAPGEGSLGPDEELSPAFDYGSFAPQCLGVTEEHGFRREEAGERLEVALGHGRREAAFSEEYLTGQSGITCLAQ
jgi:hypothetical protein